MKYQKAILCVDDEPMVLESLKLQLRDFLSEDCIIEIAESAEEGLEILDFFQHQNIVTLVLISDWLMPGMKGDEFLIRAHRKFPEVISIMLSGQADKDAVQNAKDNANLHEFINKPWEAQELIQKVEQAFKKAENALDI
ncbi:MAG: response regulator [Bernardetiaceae bacterium]|nr:response regulator [Bernardetiaceae bacterium]